MSETAVTSLFSEFLSCTIACIRALVTLYVVGSISIFFIIAAVPIRLLLITQHFVA